MLYRYISSKVISKLISKKIFKEHRSVNETKAFPKDAIQLLLLWEEQNQSFKG